MGAAQGTKEWLNERSGFATASCFADILAQPRSKTARESTSRRNYRMKLVTERLIGMALPEQFENNATRWGNLHEAAARFQVEMQLGHVIHTSEFVRHPSIDWVGCSPDGLINPDATIQIKCPFVSTHHVECFDKGVPSEHIAQIQGELWVTERDWCLFASYDPRMPDHLRLYTCKVKRDAEYIRGLKEEVLKFLDEVASMTARLLKK